MYIVCYDLLATMDQRNKLVWKQWYISAHWIINIAGQLLYQWQSAQVSKPGAASDMSFGQGGDVVWTKPPREWKKVDLDAAVFSTQGIIGAGSIVRDSEGAMVMARTTPI